MSLDKVLGLELLQTIMLLKINIFTPTDNPPHPEIHLIPHPISFSEHLRWGVENSSKNCFKIVYGKM